jgi:hypothetical protein
VKEIGLNADIFLIVNSVKELGDRLLFISLAKLSIETGEDYKSIIRTSLDFKSASEN